MSKHSKEKKQHALGLMSAPERLSVPEVALRTGVFVQLASIMMLLKQF